MRVVEQSFEFEDDTPLYALRVRVDAREQPYYVLTVPRVNTVLREPADGTLDFVIELDLHPAPIDPVLTQKDGLVGLGALSEALLRYGETCSVLLLDNQREPRRGMRVVEIKLVRVVRKFLWLEAPG